jgi:hypothetical protein
MRILLAVMAVLGFSLVIVLGLLSVARELFAKSPCQPSPVIGENDSAAASRQ